MVTLDAPEVNVELPVDKTKKTPISFANAQAGDNLIIKIKGEPNTDTNGCVGFNGTGWEQIEWEGKTDANGNLTVEIPVSKFPAGLESAEAQIWYQPELVDFDGYSFGQAEVTTTTSTETTTTTTTTTTTIVTTSTTTSTPEGKKSTGNGDANQDGTVDLADAIFIMQCLANPNKYQLSETGRQAADVYGDDGVTNDDALAIQYLLLHKISALPVPSGTVL